MGTSSVSLMFPPGGVEVDVDLEEGSTVITETLVIVAPPSGMMIIVMVTILSITVVVGHIQVDV